MLKKMRAIDYNLWMSLIDIIRKGIRDVAGEYNLVGTTIDVIPSYPRDLSKLPKTSIIVQKVSTGYNDIAFDGFLGQFYDSDVGGYVDVHGRQFDAMFQIDVSADGNIPRSMITSAITESILNMDSAVLGDYTSDINNPDPIGTVKIDKDIDTTDLAANSVHDYRTAIRIDMNVVQSVVKPQELIDLSKGFKLNQTIKL